MRALRKSSSASCSSMADLLHRKVSAAVPVMFTASAPKRTGTVGPNMKLLYKPIGLILGILSGLIGKKLFDFVWTKIDDEDPPKGTTQRAPWGKILAAA